jgi:nickel transport protein
MSALRRLALLLCLLALPATALAHRVNIFAYVDGPDIVADCFYSKSNKVNAGTITVQNAATGEEYQRVTTDAQGAARFPIPAKAIAAKADIKLVLVAGEGHQSEEIVRATEFAALAVKTIPAAPQPAAKTSAAKPAKSAPAADAAGKPAKVQAAPAAPAQIDESALSRVVETAVGKAMEEKLAPVKRLLAESAAQKGPGPTEIVGGIGYIVGIFGVAAFVASRRKSGKDS